MTKKDFILITTALKEVCPQYNCGAEIEQWVRDCRKIADSLQHNNPPFQEEHVPPGVRH